MAFFVGFWSDVQRRALSKTVPLLYSNSGYKGSFFPLPVDSTDMPLFHSVATFQLYLGYRVLRPGGLAFNIKEK